jgi:hypothetical protein
LAGYQSHPCGELTRIEISGTWFLATTVAATLPCVEEDVIKQFFCFFGFSLRDPDSAAHERIVFPRQHVIAGTIRLEVFCPVGGSRQVPIPEMQKCFERFGAGLDDALIFAGVGL